MQYELELAGRLVPEAPGYRDIEDRPNDAACGLVRGTGIAIEIADSRRLMTVREAWNGLVGRAAEPNVFMDPAMAQVAAEINPAAHIRALLAWKSDADGNRLVGTWAFSIGRPRKSLLPVQVVNVPPFLDGYLATPVVDRGCLDETLDAMLDALAGDPDLPKIMALDAMGDGPTMAALIRVLAARGSTPRILQCYQRPKLVSDLDGKGYLEQAVSGSRRKKLRQHRRRLAEQGALRSTVATDPDDVRLALEDFLRVEASGWKGRKGTAILCNATDAALMRGAVAALAEQGCASIHGLYLDRRPVSLQVVVRSGPMACTWKTAYDEHYQDYSPGMLLLEDYTAALLADKSITLVDSCAQDDTSFMSAWTERQPICNLWIDARRGGSVEFSLLGGLQKFYRDLRDHAKAAYHGLNRTYGPALRRRPEQGARRACQ